MGTSRRVDIAQLFATVARDLTAQPGMSATADRVAEVAAKLIGCGWAAVGQMGPREVLRFDATHDDSVLAAVESAAAETGEGIAAESLRLRSTVRSDDLTAERRWPQFTARVVSSTPIRSALAYFLRLDDVDLGVLALYAREPGFFNAETRELAAVYADHAAVALSHAIDQDRVDNLERALESNREIGVALGVLMAGYAITEHQAFDLLRTVSQRTHRKLRDVAGDVALTGALPDFPSRHDASGDAEAAS